jgi:hypothetical protein
LLQLLELLEGVPGRVVELARLPELARPVFGVVLAVKAKETN